MLQKNAERAKKQKHQKHRQASSKDTDRNEADSAVIGTSAQVELEMTLKQREQQLAQLLQQQEAKLDERVAVQAVRVMVRDTHNQGW
jgi:hypothetical protein